jgi:phosphinothricin acetyltransferase
MLIRKVKEEDAQAMATLYNHYVTHTNQTFETEEISAETMLGRVKECLQRYNWLVLEEDQEVIGFAYYKKFRKNIAYNHTAETAVYLNHTKTGKGYGKKLYQAMIDDAQANGFKELIGGVLLPNDGSVKIHEAMGFRKVAHFEKVGEKNGKYIDVAFWQKSIG